MFNGSVFAETSDTWAWGLELNYRADISRTDKLIVIPQAHWDSSAGFSVQGGLGFSKDNSSIKTELMLRIIYAF